MENFLNAIPTTFAGWIGSMVFIVLATFYLISRIRKNDMQLLRDANRDLRASLEDNKTKISQMHNEVKTLGEKVSDLEKKNKTLQDLVITALKQYFFENPIVAKNIKNKIIE